MHIIYALKSIAQSHLDEKRPGAYIISAFTVNSSDFDIFLHDFLKNKAQMFYSIEQTRFLMIC